MSTDAWHKQQYETARPLAEAHGFAFPNWEDLTDEQRTNIRKANQEHARWMQELGNAISFGGPIPSYPEDKA